jgi:hypothetical protein
MHVGFAQSREASHELPPFHVLFHVCSDLLHLKYKSSTKAKAEKRKRHYDPDGTEPPDLERSSSSLDEGNSFNSSRERASEANSFNSYRERASEANSYNSTRERFSEASSFNSTRERASEANSYNSTRERFSEANSYNSTRERFSEASSFNSTRERCNEANSFNSYRERRSEATSSFNSSRDRVSQAASSYTSRERAYSTSEANSFNSRERTNSSSHVTSQPSPASSAYMVAKLPLLDLENKSGESTFNLHNRSSYIHPRIGAFPDPLSSPITDVLGLEAQYLDDMELESLGDFEPLPMIDHGNDLANDIFGTVHDLHESFPTIFSPPDSHDSLPPGGLHVSLVNSYEGTTGIPSTRQAQRHSSHDNDDGSEAYDPFYQPWRMTV